MFIVGHGGDPETADTFLPIGTSVSIYAPEGYMLDFYKVIDALAGKSNPAYAYTEKIPNFTVSQLDPEMEAAAMEIAGVQEVLFIGHDGTYPEMRLCEDIAGCRDSGDGRHRCGGILSLYPDIHDYKLLVCTGDLAEPPTARDDEVKAFCLEMDYEEQRRTWNSYSPEKMAEMLGWAAIRAWRDNLYIESFCVDHGDGDFAVFRCFLTFDETHQNYYIQPELGFGKVIRPEYSAAVARVLGMHIRGELGNVRREDVTSEQEWANYLAVVDGLGLQG
ncbi:putative adhesin [Streptomyces sp. NPDC059104]|uniref:putative adhesin n=1 Tax=Streptomyces sp. NPDC059104 TaxID=3346729 RepID=UPI00368FD87E